MATGTKIVLTMQQRLDVLKDLEKCHISTVAKKYGVSLITIRRIKSNAAKISTFSKRNNHQRQRKTIREPLYQQLEDRLVLWFAERKALGDYITDHMLLEKAIELRDTIGSCSTFKVSKGWLEKFKRCHNIHVVKVFREESRQNKVAAQEFVKEFKQLIKDEDIALENVYNMDETGLLWRALPTKPQTGVQKNGVGGFKLPKDKITIGLCVNATGTHKIMPLVVYNYKKQRALKDRMKTLPVVLKSQNNAWLTQEIFIDWYNNYFISSVRRYHSEKGISGKVILLVDNCWGHKNLLDHPQDDHFKIVYLPTNTASLIQPMDQGIVVKTKMGFRHRMMQISVFKYRGGLKTFCERYNLQHCIDMLASSWDAISIGNIKNAWNKIIDSVTINVKEEEEEGNQLREMQGFMTAISKQDVTLENVRQFLYYCETCERRCFVDVEEDEEDDENKTREDNENENGEDNKMETVEDNKMETGEDNKMETGEDDEIENREDNEIKNERDTEIENGEDYKIENSEDDEIENREDNEIKNERDTEIENGEDYKIENREDDEIENREDNEIKNERDTEIENEEDNKIENGGNDEIENREDNEIKNERDAEIKNENEDQGHQDESKETNNNRVKYEEASELKQPVHQGINVSEVEKEELQYIFRRLESYNPYVPRSMQLHLEAMKICYLGDLEE